MALMKTGARVVAGLVGGALCGLLMWAFEANGDMAPAGLFCLLGGALGMVLGSDLGASLGRDKARKGVWVVLGGIVGGFAGMVSPHLLGIPKLDWPAAAGAGALVGALIGAIAPYIDIGDEPQASRTKAAAILRSCTGLAVFILVVGLCLPRPHGEQPTENDKPPREPPGERGYWRRCFRCLGLGRGPGKIPCSARGCVNGTVKEVTGSFRCSKCQGSGEEKCPNCNDGWVWIGK